MFSIEKTTIPPNTLLAAYLNNGSYVDCYRTEVPATITFCDFVFAFYTTPLFRLERLILSASVSRPSTDEQARRLAAGQSTSFAAWTVEGRSDHELLMCDLLGRTRSWFMTEPVDDSRTRFYFGSAVVPVRNSKTGERSLGVVFQALLGFHRIYSVLLRYSARRSMESQFPKDEASPL